ncbi:16S rRNA (guanine(966)-N(2))-methyltransferase RsmD [Candidatus Ishikawella capsulata]|uniref:Ribosomal RNA small subunit methyltransferase D n=1 Tax=Candidatus Ishikawaella capsulata Mpkobe TaxID=476281 RepID=C5WCE6_9ENTR|nr:16S rRNA (guanine(966)-N(2))-methyltransferase RsmD [Candidatus Ishikawaella capsulata]BAH83002.1 predicted methyltransferase [Candidatus Ishikawaella capsulata Mpkobe]
MHKIFNNINNAPGKIRIIGGKWKRRNISVIKHNGLRPTTSIARETLFNWLTNKINQARCLDCFAGTGVLGLESLSRNASQVTFLEINHKVAKQLRKNINTLCATQSELIQINALNWLKKTGEPYDIVFIDPPFHSDLLQKTFLLLEKNNWLSQEAFIYVETQSTYYSLKVPSVWNLYKEKKTSNIAYRLYFRHP